MIDIWLKIGDDVLTIRLPIAKEQIMRYLRMITVICFLVFSAMTIATAQEQTSNKPFVHPLFQDNMVIQRNMRVPVWGWAAPGSKIKVEMNGKSAVATAGSDGRWEARIGKFSAGGPYTLTISGPQTVTLKNVLVGDVWICSGQSNMEMGITQAKDGKQEIASGNYPQIRLFTIEKKLSGVPEKLLSGKWQECSSESLASQGYWGGGFSAVGYFFGRDLYKALNVPIGLVQVTWGGTFAESWISDSCLDTIPSMHPSVERYRRNVKERGQPGYNFNRTLVTWFESNVPKNASGENWNSPKLNDSDWKNAKMPTTWEGFGLTAKDGLAWFRKTVDLPDDWNGKEAVLHLGMVSDADCIWVNGHRVGSTWGYFMQRDYKVSAGMLHAGKNVITIGDLSPFIVGGGFLSGADALHLDRVDDPKKSISLAGEWKYKFVKSFDEAVDAPIKIEDDPNIICSIYNGMVAPMDRFAIKGVAWYQGESNVAYAYRYRTLLTTLIENWRSQFASGEFPFLIVQLANWQPTSDDVIDGRFTEVRNAQLQVFKSVSHTGLASAIDIGEADNIHPKNKQEVGRRLALSALAVAYKQKIEHSGPIYRSMKVEGSRIRVFFDHLGGGLVAKDSPEGKVKGFIISGADGKFVWADAVIDGNSVLVSSPKVMKPTAIRYAWKMNPVCNLYNKTGLPASPFRTD